SRRWTWAISSDVLEQEQQAAEEGGVAEESDARDVALERIALLPEAMEDHRRGDGEDDEAQRADRRMPVERDHRAAGELQHDADPEAGGGEGHAEPCHALDVIGDARLGQVRNAGNDEEKDNQLPAGE